MSLSPQDRDPAHLCQCVRTRYEAGRDILWEDMGIHITLIETLRQKDRQAWYFKLGVTSSATSSQHLAQAPKLLSLAADCVPTSYLTVKGWNSNGEEWKKYGSVMKGQGLLWGGDWRRLKLASFDDKPHIYLRKCQCDE